MITIWSTLWATLSGSSYKSDCVSSHESRLYCTLPWRKVPILGDTDVSFIVVIVWVVFGAQNSITFPLAHTVWQFGVYTVCRHIIGLNRSLGTNATPSARDIFFHNILEFPVSVQVDVILYVLFLNYSIRGESIKFLVSLCAIQMLSFSLSSVILLALLAISTYRLFHFLLSPTTFVFNSVHCSYQRPQTSCKSMPFWSRVTL